MKINPSPEFSGSGRFSTAASLSRSFSRAKGYRVRSIGKNRLSCLQFFNCKIPVEYTGNHFKQDMAVMAADPVTQEWWKLTAPCQQGLETRGEGEWWSTMEELFHHD